MSTMVVICFALMSFVAGFAIAKLPPGTFGICKTSESTTESTPTTPAIPPQQFSQPYLPYGNRRR